MHLNKELARQFVRRSEHQGLKGKKRDVQCIEFFVGAAVALGLVGRTDEQSTVLTYTGLVLQTRGYEECAKLAATPDAEAA